MAARTLNLILALWLFSSAFVWPRTTLSLTNAWLVGLAQAALAFAGMQVERLRFVNTALSAWLLASALVLPQRSLAAPWNDALLAVAMLALSLIPGSMYHRIGRTSARA